VILCANILLREAAQRINLQPQQQATDLELCYRIQVTCGEQDEILVRTLILQALNGVALRLQSLRRADIASPGQLEVCAEITATPAAQKEIEGIVCRVSLEKSVSAVRWRVASELPV
jgi:putative Mg2+ transporter-C (MgtC) family protein